MIKHWILFLLFAFSCIFICAQEYDSTYVPEEGLVGHAKFEYYKDLDGLIVKNGDFIFETTNGDTTWSSEYEKLKWEGKYAENKKVGPWTYLNTTHQLDILSVEDDRLNYDLRTYRTEIKANYERGTPAGDWQFKTQRIEKGKSAKPHEQISIRFKKGYADGNFSQVIYHEEGLKTEIKGQFKNGFMIGDWSFKYYHNKSWRTETRSYNNGVLLFSVLDDDTLRFPLSPKTEAVLEKKREESLVRPSGFSSVR